MRLFHVHKRQLTCLFLGCYKFWNSVNDFRTRIPTSSISMAANLLGASLISPSHPNVGNRTFRHQFGTNFAPTSAAPAFKKLSVRVLTRNEYYSILNELNQPPKPAHGIDRRTLSKTDLSNSARDGGQLRVAYQGVSGAFSESAAAKAYPHCITVPCEQFEIAFEAVEKMVADRAVLPIENSVGGSIHRNYDLLLRHRLHIVGEVELAVRHCLLANHGVKVEHLKSVISHQQALYQCEYTLAKLKVEKMAVADTAGAAKFVALHKLRDTGAVASIDAAKIYDLNVLAQDIQDYSDNVTRFLMLAREPIISLQGTAFKTSIVFSLDEGSGMLYKALAVFAMRNINLTKIESRPQKKHPLRLPAENSTDSKYFDYLFYCDFEASMADINAQNALNHLKEFATFLRVLGSYPKDVST